MLRFIIFMLLAFGGAILAVVIEGGNLLKYVGFSAFLVAISIPVFSSFGVWKAGEVFTAWKDPFSKKKNDSFTVSMKILEFQEKLFYITGVIGLIIGFVLVLINIKPANTVDITCSSFAAALICPLYGIIFGVIMRVMRARVENIMSN